VTARNPGIRALARVGLLASIVVVPSVRDLSAQEIVVPPSRSLGLPNYDRIPVGQREGVEAGAFVARTNDAGAGWYNPAGLAQADKSALNASANAYEWTRLTFSGLGASTDRAEFSSLSTYVGAVVGRPPLPWSKWRLGVSVTRPLSWSPGELNAAFYPPSSGGTERLGYSSNVDLSTQLWGLSVGYAPRGVGKSPLRVGGGIAVAHTSLSQDLRLSDRITTSTTASTQLRSLSADGSANSLVATGGLQWDMSRRVAFGLRVVSAGIGITRGGSLELEGSDFSSNSSADATLRDEHAGFNYKIPFETDAGITFRFGRGEIEGDVRYYGSIDRYVLYESDSLATITRVSGDNPPVVSSAPFPTAYNSAKSVTNVAMGGNYRVTSALTLRAGFGSDMSPVATVTASNFVQADLYRASVGLTFAWTSLSGSLGAAYDWGAGDRGNLATTASGAAADTRLEVRTINLVYAFSYAFGAKSGQ
jgi:hypothetical protein